LEGFKQLDKRQKENGMNAMPKIKANVRTSQELLQEFHKANWETAFEKVNFDGVGGRDVYNITAPFQDEGEEIILGRVEERNSEFSQVFFFRRIGDVWLPREHTPTFNLQDPFIVKIGGEIIFGGVEVLTESSDPTNIVSWVTQFYRGKTIDSLRHFASGPDRMKDIRLIELADGRIGVFTRPQGAIGGRGQIGFLILQTLEELNSERLVRSHIFNDQFIEEEWGGVNEAQLLENGWIGVLGHIACMDPQGHKHYYSIVFALNPETLGRSPLKIIAERNDFPPGPGKRIGLEDVIFSGGLRRLGHGRAELSVGVSDAEAFRIEIPDPFEEYESAKDNL
jgi:hypothetical protein